MAAPVRMTHLESVLAVFPTSECVEWPGRRDPDGYGHNAAGTAHRTVYETVIGPIGDGLTIDHLCRNRACVNPAHMEPVTSAVNIRRGGSAQKSSCLNGHPFDHQNTYRRPNGGRDCRMCKRERGRHSARRRRWRDRTDLGGGDAASPAPG